MRARIRRRRRNRVEVSQDLELMPMLNVFISIIPLLLLSAAFVKLGIIPTTLPAAAAPAVADPADEPAMSLTIVIAPDAYVVEVNGAAARSVLRPAGVRREAASAEAARARLGDVLKAAVAGRGGRREVRIAAGSKTHYEDIIDVMDVSRAAGLPEAALADAVEGAH